MSNKTVITANGNSLDMEALRLKHEKTVAVGNMRVNARGDELSASSGEVVRTRNQRMNDYYKLHSTVPTAKPRKKAEAKQQAAPAPQAPAPQAQTSAPVVPTPAAPQAQVQVEYPLRTLDNKNTNVSEE